MHVCLCVRSNYFLSDAHPLRDARSLDRALHKVNPVDILSHFSAHLANISVLTCHLAHPDEECVSLQGTSGIVKKKKNMIGSKNQERERGGRGGGWGGEREGLPSEVTRTMMPLLPSSMSATTRHQIYHRRAPCPPLPPRSALKGTA